MTDATQCAVCGGPFSAKRVWIDGAQLHERCALMSHGSHTHEDYARLSEQFWRLAVAVKEARAWFLKPENVDLNGSDRVYRLIDDALDTEYGKVVNRDGGMNEQDG